MASAFPLKEELTELGFGKAAEAPGEGKERGMKASLDTAFEVLTLPSSLAGPVFQPVCSLINSCFLIFK